MRKFLTILSGVLIIAFSAGAAMAQHVVGRINATGEWSDAALYQTGDKFFVSDYTNNQILVYDAGTLANLGTIPLSAYTSYGPQDMAVHEGTGTLYVALLRWFPMTSSTIVIINANTYSVIGSLTGFGSQAGLFMDESRGRLYVIGGHRTLTAINVNTNTIAGSLDVGKIIDPNGARVQYEYGDVLNPVTGELVFGCLGGNGFVIVDGPNLTGELISAPGSLGWAGTWNPHENKIYITRKLWDGYFIYDRDTGTSKIANSFNDGTSLFYSQATNRIYSGAEVNWDSTVIEGDTDAWQDIEVGAGLSQVGFVTATRHAYFAADYGVRILDEDTLKVVGSIPGCGSAGVSGTNIVIDQNRRRVFIRSHWCDGDYDPGNSCVLVIDDLKPKLTIQPASNGTTNPSPGEHYYATGTQVQVTAIPDANYEFINWTGDISSTNNPMTVTVNGDMTIKANFRLKPKLTIQLPSNGTTNPSPGEHYYATGTQVQVTAIPNTNCEFVNWTGDISSPQNPATVTVNVDMTIKANFRLKPKLTILPASNGTTNPSPGVYYYATGTQVQISPIPNTYCVFINWSGSATGSADPLSLTMTGDKTVSAYFRYVYAPLATGAKVLNRNFSYAEYINVLSWQADPANDGLDIAKYKIYVVSNDTPTLLVELAGSQLKYSHRNAGKSSIQYAIRAVTSSGSEGEPALVTVQ